MDIYQKSTTEWTEQRDIADCLNWTERYSEISSNPPIAFWNVGSKNQEYLMEELII
jgi:hypothetical protein